MKSENEEQLYSFNGKIFPCDQQTIDRLNYALALNHREERYILVKKNKKHGIKKRNNGQGN